MVPPLSEMLLLATISNVPACVAALLPVPALDKENGFGRVTFRVSQKQEGTSTQVQVRFQTQLLRPATPASAERELREYLGWVKEAYHTKLILERP